MANDLLRNRAEERAAQTGPAVAPDDDEIECRITIEHRDNLRAGAAHADPRNHRYRAVRSHVRCPLLEQRSRTLVEALEEVSGQRLTGDSDRQLEHVQERDA